MYLVNRLVHDVVSKYIYEATANNELTDYLGIIDKLFYYLKEIVLYLIKDFIQLITYILRPLYIFLIIFGVLHYAVSGLSPKNRRYLYGGILLAIFTELILPILLKIANF